jgi:hypothetical protein
MPVVEAVLQLDQGTTPTWTLCWIAGGVSVNPAGTTPTCLFRQSPNDTPLVQFTNVPNTNGSVITYATPIPNSPIAVPGDIIYVTLYPIVLSLAAADMALLIYPFMQAKLNLLWTTSPVVSIDLVHWQVEISSV